MKAGERKEFQKIKANNSKSKERIASQSIFQSRYTKALRNQVVNFSMIHFDVIKFQIKDSIRKKNGLLPSDSIP